MVFSLLFSACGESFLEVEPSNAVLTKKAIETVRDVEVAVTAMYNDLQSKDWMNSALIAIPGVMADDIMITIDNSNRYTASYGYYVQEGHADPLGIWVMPYRLIRKANSIIERIDDGVKGDTATLEHYKGVALGLRAFAHFDLVRMFAHPYSQGGDALGVPIVTKALPRTSEPARNTVAEVYSQIIKDLNDAIELLDSKKISRGEFHYWGAKALLSRVYLYHEDWDLAAELATEVVENNHLALRDEYLQIFNGNNPESIFELINTAIDHGKDHIGKLIYPSPIGYGNVIVTKRLKKLLGGKDIRSKLLKSSKVGLVPFKYPTAGVSDNIQIIRTSEICLIAAEAYARGTNPNKDKLALQYLNRIIGRATTDHGALVSNLEGQALVDRILVEREKELFCEGHRLFDLTRNNKTINRGKDYWGNKKYLNIPSNHDRTILPIPISELNVNGNIDQNPGY